MTSIKNGPGGACCTVEEGDCSECSGNTEAAATVTFDVTNTAAGVDNGIHGFGAADMGFTSSLAFNFDDPFASILPSSINDENTHCSLNINNFIRYLTASVDYTFTTTVWLYVTVPNTTTYPGQSYLLVVELIAASTRYDKVGLNWVLNYDKLTKHYWDYESTTPINCQSLSIGETIPTSPTHWESGDPWSDHFVDIDGADFGLTR